MGWEIDKKSHHIERLIVHLPDDQVVYYQPGENIRKVLERAAAKDSKLTAWFKLNRDDPDARNYYYYEIPEHYTWKDNGWKPREGGKKTLGRMFTVSHKQEELFFLRLLLINVKGAQSWEDLLRDETDSEKVYPTFKESAEARGLLEDDQEWERYFLEMSSFKMPKDLRNLFVTILYYAQPSTAKILWKKFKREMSEDLLRQCGGDEKLARQHAKADIERMLREMDKSLTDYNISLPKDVEIPSGEQQWNREEEKAMGEKMHKKMTKKQKKIVKNILKKVENYRNGIRAKKGVFIDGPGGTGKTYTYRTLCHMFRGKVSLFLVNLKKRFLLTKKIL